MSKVTSHGVVFGTFIGVMAVFAGLEDYIVVLPIALGVLNGFINKKMIDLFKVGKIYHAVQLAALFTIMGILIWTKLVLWDEALLMTMFYWIPFEMSLNLFRGREYDYIGHTTWPDKTIRGMFKSYGLARTFLTVVKVILAFTGFTIYMFNK